MLHITDLEKTEASLARHILAIMDHPKTPNNLYNKIADFITDSTNIRDSAGESLLDRWTYSPETVTALVTWAKEADDKKEIAEELMGKANAVGVNN